MSNDSKAKAPAVISLHDQIAQWESQLLNDHDNMSLHDAEGLLMRCVKLSQVLVATVQKKRKDERDKQEQTPNPKSSSRQDDEGNEAMIRNVTSRKESSTLSTSMPIPSEVLRLLIPHSTAKEMGRLFLLTSPHIVPMLGHSFVWKELCLKLWPDSMPSQLGIDWWIRSASSSFNNNNNNNNHSNNAFQWYFLQRQKSILLQDDDQLLQQLPKPHWNPDYMTLGIDIYNEQGELVHTRTIDNFLSQVDDFVSNGTVTIHLEEPVPVGSLPTGRGCHCWNLRKSYPGWKARLHVFADDNTTDTTESSDDDDVTHDTKSGGTTSTSFRGRQCHTLLDTGFSVWRGFSDNGELTFIQKERTKGLQLTDRGRFLQHRIVTGASKTPNWRNFLGLQAKVILVCEKTYDANGETSGDDDDSEDDVDFSTSNPTHQQQFGFTSLRIQAIRLHENSAGNVQHSLYRKDSGWHTHGVELLHLLEELI